MSDLRTSAMSPGPSGRGRRRAVRTLVLTGLLLLALDQGTKHAAVSLLSEDEPVRLLGGAVYLSLTRNSGAAFSLGSDYTFVFPIITIAVILWIAAMARRLVSTGWAVALGLILGGALGNLGDRIFRAPGPFVGHVVDMISLFDARGQVWPVFNVADTALMMGVGMAIVLELMGRRREGVTVVVAERPGGESSAGRHRSDRDGDSRAGLRTRTVHGVGDMS